MKTDYAFLQKSYLPITLLAIFAILIFSIYSVNRHLTFNSHALDLGIFTQATFLYSQGELPYSSLKKMVILGDHFDPILFLISPLYKIFPSAILLLFLQSIFVSLSVIPLYFIAIDKIKNKILVYLLLTIYLTSPLLLRAVSFDFHPGTMSLLPLSVLIYGWYFNKQVVYWIAFFTSFLFKEEMAFYIFGLGIYQIFKKQYKLGLLTSFVSVFLFYVIKFYLMPFFWPNSNQGYIQTLNLPLSNPLDMMLILLTRPDIIFNQIFNPQIKLETLNQIFRQFGYLPIFNSFALFTILPFMFLRFTSNLSYLWGTEFHNNAPLLPFLFVGTILTIYKFKLPVKFSYLFLYCFFILNLIFSNFALAHFIPSLKENTKYNYLYQHLSQIPKQAAISAQTTLVPHLANRKELYLFPEISNSEYIILDSSLDSYPLSKKELLNKIRLLKESDYWKLIKEEKELVFLKRLTTGSKK